jgi:hypothetical protein
MIGYFLNLRKGLPSEEIFSKELADALRDLGYFDEMNNVQGTLISEVEKPSEVALYTARLGWKNTIGALLLLYKEIVDYDGIAEVIFDA